MGRRWIIALVALACAPRDDLSHRLYLSPGLSYNAATVVNGALMDGAWKVPCQFTKTGDGKLRCLPVQQMDRDVQFLDDHCRQPATTSFPGAGVEGFSVILSGDQCHTTAELYRRSPTKRSVSTFEQTSAGCVANPIHPQSVFPLERITDQAVEGTRVRGTVRGGLAPVYFVAEGRILWIDGWHAEDLDADCQFTSEDPVSFRARTGGLMRCWPVDVTGERDETFADSACMLPAVREGLTCDPPERFAVLSDHSRQCPTPRTAFRIRGTVPTGFRRQGPSCTVDTAPGRVLFLGEEVPAERWPAGQLLVPDGPQRIRAAVIQTAADQIGTNDLWDDQLAHFCEPRPTDDGHIHCVPTDAAALFDDLYADEACTQPVVRAQVVAGGCADAFAARFDARGRSVTQLFHLGPRHDGPVFSLATGACAPSFVTDGSAAFDLGDEIPLESLALLEGSL